MTSRRLVGLSGLALAAADRSHGRQAPLLDLWRLSTPHIHPGTESWPLLPGSDDPHAMSPLYASVQGDGYLVSRAQEALLQGNPQVLNSNAMQHAAMLLVPLVPPPLVPQLARPPSPELDAATTHGSGDLEQHRAIRQAQDVEYAQAEAIDLQRQNHQMGTSGVERPETTRRGRRAPRMSMPGHLGCRFDAGSAFGIIAPPGA